MTIIPWSLRDAYFRNLKYFLFEDLHQLSDLPTHSECMLAKCGPYFIFCEELTAIHMSQAVLHLQIFFFFSLNFNFNFDIILPKVKTDCIRQAHVMNIDFLRQIKLCLKTCFVFWHKVWNPWWKRKLFKWHIS